MTKVKSFLFSMVVNLIIIFSFIFCFTNLTMSVEPDEILENKMYWGWNKKPYYFEDVTNYLISET